MFSSPSRVCHGPVLICYHCNIIWKLQWNISICGVCNHYRNPFVLEELNICYSRHHTVLTLYLWFASPAYSFLSFFFLYFEQALLFHIHYYRFENGSAHAHAMGWVIKIWSDISCDRAHRLFIFYCYSLYNFFPHLDRTTLCSRILIIGAIHYVLGLSRISNQ